MFSRDRENQLNSIEFSTEGTFQLFLPTSFLYLFPLSIFVFKQTISLVYFKIKTKRSVKSCKGTNTGASDLPDIILITTKLLSPCSLLTVATFTNETPPLVGANVTKVKHSKRIREISE